MSASLEKRVQALELQVARLQQGQVSPDANARAWIDDLYGAFAGGAIFEQAMKLRKYRRSLRPRAKKSIRKR